MGDYIYEDAKERHEFAKKLLEAIKKSDFQIIITPKFSKTKLIKFLRSTIQDLKITMNIHKDCEFNLVDEFTDANPNLSTPVELPTSDGKTIRILTKEQVEKIEMEVEEIEMYYPGENELTKQEKLCRKSFDSLHDYQFFISQVRRGVSQIFRNGDGSLSIVLTE